MRMAGMKVRKRALVSESAMPSLGGGDAIAQAVAGSPIPLAIFEPSGAVRFANRAFVELLEGPEADRLPRFDELRAVERDPSLSAALAQAVTTMKPVRRMVLAGPPGRERMHVLVLAPAAVATGGEARLEGVHATLIDTRE
jgi:PAS domain-containing protein